MLEWLDTISREAGLLGLVALFLSSMIEYVFPPFPGDTITLAGGFYAVRAGMPVALVFAVLLAGSLAGATIDYFVGVWVGRRIGGQAPKGRWLRSFTPEKIAEWEERFRRRGAWWLTVNRFLPGIRGPIFVAAGISRVPYARVLVFGGVSSFAWNALLFGVGYFAGLKAEHVQELANAYGRAMSGALIAIAAILVGRWAWRRFARGGRMARGERPRA